MRFSQAASDVLLQGGGVVTSSARAARQLHRRFGDLARDYGLSAWKSPGILDWDRWTDELWQQRLLAGRETRLLLNSQQERTIWLRLVTLSADNLLSPVGVADLAQSAYSLLCSYEAESFLHEGSFEGLDIERFREWARAFERECSLHGWLSRSRLAGELAKASSVSFPERLLLIGFDRIPPAEQRLLAACERAGTQVRQAAQGEERPVEAFLRARDPLEEIEICAQWLQRAIQRFEAAGRVRAALILPDQSNRRGELERVLRQVLAPEADSLALSSESLPFEFSLGVPLAQMPMVRAALLMLSWLEKGLVQEDVSWLMLSGFLWGRESDLLPIAGFDAERRKDGFLPLEQRLDSFLRRGEWSGQACIELSGRLRAARRIWREGAMQRRGFDEWVELAGQVLAAAGWPGPCKLASEEFQVQARWSRLLDTIATLSFDGSSVTYPEFLRTLHREARETIFSPESRGAPVQILGPHEAAGMEFDFLWFLGADDVDWPRRSDPHPFLPRRLQTVHDMPHAESSRDWEMAKLVTRRLQASTGRMVASFAAQSADGPRRPSTVFEVAPAEIQTPADFRMRFGIHAPEPKPAPLLLEEEESAFGPVWPIELQAGGVGVLKSQAACPFQAFTAFRLGASEVTKTDWGLNPMKRGELLHRALAVFWREVADSASLHRAHSEGRLQEIVERSVAAAFEPYRKKAGTDSWSHAYLEAEEERLSALIGQWLEQDLRRNPFRVEATEERLTADVDGLQLRMRADRIDSTPAGRLILDYKTGRVGNPGWDDPRIDDPQLPLYAAYGGVSNLRGVVLAQIRTGEIKFKRGCVDDPDAMLFPGALARSAAYAGQEEMWRTTLSQLAGQFLAGLAAIDPKYYPETCRYCSFAYFCRIAEQKKMEDENRAVGRAIYTEEAADA